VLLRTLESRRRVLLCAFGALCVLPTLLTAGWSLIRNWPGQVQQESDRLAQRLGVLVELSALRHPRPGVLVYEGLKLADPETGRTLLRCRTLEVQWRKVAAADGQLRPVAIVIAAEPQIDGRAVERLWSIVSRALVSDPAAGNTDVRIWASTARLQCGTQVYQLNDVHCGTESIAAGSVAAASFRLAGNDSSHLVRMRWLRDRREEAIAEQFELDTGGASIPCSLFAAAVPELRRLGTNSTFQGRFWLRWPAQRSAPQRCHGELVGQLAGVDLSALTAGLGSYKLAGTADVWIQYARIADGRLEESSCVLQGGPGIISRRLIEAAVERLGLSRGTAEAALTELLRYDQLAFAVHLSAAGVHLQGRCVLPEPGALLAVDRRCLLGEPLVQPQPIARVIQLLALSGAEQVPGTSVSGWLMRRLPLEPPSQAISEQANAPARSPTGNQSLR